MAGHRLTGWLKRMPVAAAVAFLILGGVVVGRYADEALPTEFLWRPLIVALLLALAIGVLAAFGGRWAPAVAAAAAVGLLSFVVGYVLVAIVLVSAVAARLAARRSREWPLASAYARAALTISAVFFLLGALRAAAYLDPPGQASSTAPTAGRSVYLILLDGYPRADTLRQDLGIDNGPFIGDLAARGFDTYDDARSARGYTELTLLSLLNGSDAGVPHESGAAADKRAARRQLDEARLPLRAMDSGYGYVVIDSPIGHVSFTTGRHIRHAGVTDFEERLLAASSLGGLLAAVAPDLLTSSLRAHLDDSLASLVELSRPGSGRLVLAHLMAPHLPFLYAADGSGLPVPPYWPRDQLFGSVIEDIEIDLDYYRTMYGGHLRTVNAKVLATVDAMIAADPDAVIVLFSDHGARYSFDAPEEWQRSFLAARTPGRPGLFGAAPTTTSIMCLLFEAYLEPTCD